MLREIVIGFASFYIGIRLSNKLKRICNDTFGDGISRFIFGEDRDISDEESSDDAKDSVIQYRNESVQDDVSNVGIAVEELPSQIVISPLLNDEQFTVSYHEQFDASDFLKLSQLINDKLDTCQIVRYLFDPSSPSVIKVMQPVVSFSSLFNGEDSEHGCIEPINDKVWSKTGIGPITSLQMSSSNPDSIKNIIYIYDSGLNTLCWIFVKGLSVDCPDFVFKQLDSIFCK